MGDELDHTHDHDHDDHHVHDEDCGHDHGPPVVHGLTPRPEETAVVLLAAGPGAGQGALAKLGPPFGPSGGELGLARMRRALASQKWARWVVVSEHGEPGRLARGVSGRWASHAVSRGSSDGLTEGLQVTFQVARPPTAALIWSAARPLTSGHALKRLMMSGTRQLSRAELPWVRVLARSADLTSAGQPMLISRAAAEVLLARGVGVQEAIAAQDGALLVQRVLVEEPWPWTPVESGADAESFGLRGDLR